MVDDTMLLTDAVTFQQVNKRLKDVFSAADANEDGRISRDEMQRVLSEIGDWTPKQFTQLFKDADFNKDGYLSIYEFVDWLVPQPIVHQSMLKDFAESIKSIFDEFDTDGSEYISKQELKEGLQQKILDGLLPQRFEVFFLQADENGNDCISLGEFRAWMEEVLPNDE
jgi:Ca2+-binding EF-hand superfamily protein